jgi:thiosulfate/3-mercaptopyruvate sulfurtransferase
VEAYNGWRLKKQCRGGSIRGARSLPVKWTRYIDWIEIVQSKGITPRHSLVLYGSDPIQTETVARLLEKTGYSGVQVYHRFIEEWTADDGLPMEILPRYRHLVSARWLHTLIGTGRAPEYNGKGWVLCHAHYRNPDAYNSGHIPGALSLDTNTLESSETWNRRSPEELRATLAALGIRHDTTVVLYGKFTFPDSRDPFPGSSAGQLGAMRCAVILLYAGVRDVRILNGGYQSWIDEGYEPVTRPAEPEPVADFGAEIPGQPGYMSDLAEARQILSASDANLVSVRSWPEYTGQVSGYHYIEQKGRIPGSVFGNSGSDAYHMENYRNLDHTTREWKEIVKNWEEAGITPDKKNAFYCGTGWRASEAFFNAWLMKWPRISVYDGGWFEWSRDPENPVETGEPG